MRGLSPLAASGGHSSSRCAGLSPSRPLLLRSTGSRCPGSVVVAHGPSCSAACGIFPDQGSNPCPLHWQADSQPLRHQGSPYDHSYTSLAAHMSAFLLCIYLRVPSLDDRVCLCSVLVDTFSFLKCLYQVTVPQAVYENYNCSTWSSTLGIVSRYKLSSLGSRL